MASIDYNQTLQDIIDYFNSTLIAYDDLTFGLAQPEPFNFTGNETYIIVGYPDKAGESGHYSDVSVHAHIDLMVPLVICCNRSTIESSREEAWDVLQRLEQVIRDDITFDSMEFLMRAVPRGAIGEDHSGTEYRLTLTLDCRMQLHG